MRLEIHRTPTVENTFGKLYVDGVFECYSLEDIDRELEKGGFKVAGDTAIPRGKYQIIVDQSQRWHRMMMHIMDVPGFEGVRIHAGNTVADTEGCILLGNGVGKAYLYDSRAAVTRLQMMVEAALDQGDEVTLEII